MDFRGFLPCSEEKGTSRFPASSFQGSWIPETPVKPVPARRQMDEGDGQLLLLGSLEMSATLHNPALAVQNPGSAEPSSGSAVTSQWEGVQALNLPTEDGANWQRQVYGNEAAAGFGWGCYDGNDACSFTDSGSVATQASGKVLRSSSPAAHLPQSTSGWHQNDVQHSFLDMPHSLSNGVWQQRCNLETNGLSNGYSSHTNQFWFPVPYEATLYGTQSPPYKVASNSSTSKARGAPIAPVTPEKSIGKERLVDSRTMAPVDYLFTDERVHQEGQLDNPMTPSKVSIDDNQNEIGVDDSLRCQVDSQESVTHSPVKGSFDCGNADADGIDLNKTPKQKSKRKKIRPKVVREDKPKRTPKKMQVNQTPEGALVERKGRASTGRRTRKTPISSSMGVRESDCLHANATRIASCKRSLNFDLVAPAFNGHVFEQPETDKFGPVNQHLVEGEKGTVENFSEHITFDLNHSLNHVLESQPAQPMKPCTPPLKRKASLTSNPYNMPQKKNSTENGGSNEKHQEILSTMTCIHIPEGMIGSNLIPVYSARQKNERIMPMTSENSTLSPATGIANVETNTQGPLNDDRHEASSPKASIDLVQTHLKHAGSLLELLEEIMRQAQADGSGYERLQFQDSFGNQNTEMRREELQSHSFSTSFSQASARKAGEEHGIINTNHLAVQSCNEALLLQSCSKEEKQKVIEPNKCIHDNTSLLLESTKEHGHTKQSYPGKISSDIENVLECKDTLVHVEGKRKRSPKKQPKHSNQHRTLFFSSATPKGCTQEFKEHRPEAHQGDLLANRLAQKSTKQRRKGVSHTMKSVPPITLDEHEIYTDQGQGSQAVSGSNHVRRPRSLAISSMQFVHDCHSSSNLRAELPRSSPSQTIAMDPVNEIIQQLRCLDISKKDTYMTAIVQNAIVPYINGTMVPYTGSFEPLRKRRPRPKVDLDEETNRVWNLLMGSQTSEGIDGTHADKVKWWEEERRIFRGRVDSFIARMHLIQGDRRFSQWKGSVVDSVVGVFLTQNVSDHLSSSAFMALAARFSRKEMRECTTLHRNKIIATAQVKDLLSRDLHDMNVHTDKTTYIENPEPDCTPLRIQDSKCKESTLLDITNKPESCGSNMAGKKENYTNIIYSIFEELLQDSSGNTKLFQSISESEGRSAEYENGTVLSLSVISSQNSTDSTVLATDQIASSLEPIPLAEELLNKSEQDSFHQPSFSELLSMAGSPMFKDLYSTGYLNLLHEDKVGEEHDQLLHENWRTNADKAARAGSSVGVGNNPVINEITKSFPEATSYITMLGSHSFPKARETNFSVESYTVEPNKPGKLQEANRMVASSSEAKLAADVHPFEDTIPMNNQKPMENQAEVNSQDKTVASRNKSNPKLLKSNKGKGEALSRKEKWESLRRQALKELDTQERSPDKNDSLDWEAVRRADVSEIAQTIKERGMNNMLAARIQDFLNRLVEDHGSIDLEWLRNVSPDKSKDFLLSINGLGLKSVECVRLLTLQHLAFPVDTNVGRICVRLGWVPLQPLPESLQLHLLELYPVLETIQKYLWPRLCKLDQRTLYELHYQLITFGKVFCTKSRPNCNACPMRGECKHFASAFASARLALPAPEERSLVTSTVTIMAQQERGTVAFHSLPPPVELPTSIEFPPTQERATINTCQPIIEEPATPEPEYVESSKSAIVEFNFDDPDEIPTIKLNLEELTSNIKNYIQEKNMELQESDMSKALVALTPEAASIPTPKLKNVSRLRTEHQVYELPDDHPLLKGLDKREPDDPCFYLLAIWTPGETAESVEPPQACCDFQSSGGLCNNQVCFSCNAIRETNCQIVRGTLLIPCRTAMRGSFPLNGTYFQVNEVFADHESSLNPIGVPRELIWNLPRRTVYFGTSVTTIFRGLTTEGIQYCFWRGFVCVRGFDLKTRAPRPLMARLHFPASKQPRNKKATAKYLDE